MTDNQIEKKVYTTCPFTAQENAWNEKEHECGKWKGVSSVDGSSITSNTWDGLRLRYEKLLTALLIAKENGKELFNK